MIAPESLVQMTASALRGKARVLADLGDDIDHHALDLFDLVSRGR
jgi:hypothetical protein